MRILACWTSVWAWFLACMLLACVAFAFRCDAWLVCDALRMLMPDCRKLAGQIAVLGVHAV